MNNSGNPIYLTQKRLVHRGGVLAAILIAALIGVSLLVGLTVYLKNPASFGFRSKEEAGKMFYGWVVGVEGLILIAGGFSRITRSLSEDRKAGLWDSNRLTPLYPWQLVTGYWFGAALRETYMSAMLAVLGLGIVVLADLSFKLWLGTQVLILSTGLFFGLLGMLTGLAFDRPRSGILLLLALLFTQMFSMVRAKAMVTNFLLPVYAIVNLFGGERDWSGPATFWGVPVNAVIFTLVLQVVIGWFLWRTAIRKTKNPSQPLFQKWEAIAVFSILLVVQHGLMANDWRGIYDEGYNRFDRRGLISFVHVGTLMVGAMMLAFASPMPERVRIDSMRLGSASFGMVFLRSAVSLAIAFSLISGICLYIQIRGAGADGVMVWLVAAGNILTTFMMFTLLVEFCRLRFKRRAASSIALWLFIFCILPFILAGVFSSDYIGRLSFLSPGVLAFSDELRPNNYDLSLIVLGHAVIVVGLSIFWWQQWKKLLQKRPIPPPLPAAAPKA